MALASNHSDHADHSNHADHYVLADDEAEATWFLGCLVTIKAVGARTGGVLGLVEILHPEGFATPRHIHHGEDEAFYVIEGSMQGFCGDQHWQATAGAFIWLPRDIPHGYAVVGDEPLRTLVLLLPGGEESFFAEAGEPAQARTLPPPGAPDIEKLLAAGAKYQVETLGPLEG